MRFKKNKPEPEQGSGRRVRQGSQPSSPAFSYYTNRTPEVSTASRNEKRQETPGEGKRGERSFLAHVPFWVLMAVMVVCAGKLLLLSTSPKVVVVGKSAVSATYLQPTSVYQAAAQEQLGSSITNRTKPTVNLAGVAAALEQEFPELQTVSLTLPLIGNRPIVYVQVAQPSVILQTTHGNYALNKAGLVLARVKTLPAQVPVVVDQSGVAPHPGKQYLPGSTITFIQTLEYQLTAAHLVISTFVLPPANPYELDLRLEGQSYVIRCNLQADALTQSGAAIGTVQQLGTAVPASYIDVRVPERVYYK